MIFVSLLYFLDFRQLFLEVLYSSSILGAEAASGGATVLKKRLRHRWFPMNLAKFLKTPFLQSISVRLLQ